MNNKKIFSITAILSLIFLIIFILLYLFGYKKYVENYISNYDKNDIVEIDAIVVDKLEEIEYDSESGNSYYYYIYIDYDSNSYKIKVSKHDDFSSYKIGSSYTFYTIDYDDIYLSSDELITDTIPNYINIIKNIIFVFILIFSVSSYITVFCLLGTFISKRKTNITKKEKKLKLRLIISIISTIFVSLLFLSIVLSVFVPSDEIYSSTCTINDKYNKSSDGHIIYTLKATCDSEVKIIEIDNDEYDYYVVDNSYTFYSIDNNNYYTSVDKAQKEDNKSLIGSIIVGSIILVINIICCLNLLKKNKK